ncbi:hypothetical protein [Mycoplasmopsis bovis]
MAKQLSVNERKYLFEKYEKYRSGELTKKCFFFISYVFLQCNV